MTHESGWGQHSRRRLKTAADESRGHPGSAQKLTNECKSEKCACLKHTKKDFATILATMVKLSTTNRPIKMLLMTGHMMLVIIEGNDPRNPKTKKAMWRLNVTNAQVPMQPHNCPKHERKKGTYSGCALEASPNR